METWGPEQNAYIVGVRTTNASRKLLRALASGTAGHAAWRWALLRGLATEDRCLTEAGETAVYKFKKRAGMLPVDPNQGSETPRAKRASSPRTGPKVSVGLRMARAKARRRSQRRNVEPADGAQRGEGLREGLRESRPDHPARVPVLGLYRADGPRWARRPNPEPTTDYAALRRENMKRHANHLGAN